MNDEELNALLRRATRHQASEPLRAAVRTQLALAAARGEAASPPSALAANQWRGVLAGFACGAALSLALVWALPRWLALDSLPAEVVASHVRALKVGPLFDVASSDRHIVKPWFQGKLDFAPAVPDLAADGFVLMGGRVAHFAGTPVAALAYTRRLHVINVFQWPAPGVSGSVNEQLRGFNLQHWHEGGFQVWVVADMDAQELERFASAWRARRP
jgi:anti-sigma factor RsiW